jgi:hypothetical protein
MAILISIIFIQAIYIIYLRIELSNKKYKKTLMDVFEKKLEINQSNLNY